VFPYQPGWSTSDGVWEDPAERARIAGVVGRLHAADVLFALDEADLTAEASDRLAGVAEQIRADDAGGAVTVAGHTADQGSVSYNQGFSERRAEAVRAALAEQLAGEDIEFETVGHGESKPQGPEHRRRRAQRGEPGAQPARRDHLRRTAMISGAIENSG